MEIKCPEDRAKLHPYINFVNAVYRNQFCFNHNNDVFEEIKQQQNKNTHIIRKGTNLYRARMSEANPRNGSYCESAINGFEEFDAKELNAPELKLIKAGRANTKYVRYLYLADSEYCAVSEVRPTIGYYVTVGTGNTIKELKCYSLAFSPQNNDPLLCLKNDFRKPQINKESYLITQIITQYIQSLGYDGIIFSSAQYANGLNYVLFKPENFVVNSSKRYFINNIAYSISRKGNILYPPNTNQQAFKQFFEKEF